VTLLAFAADRRAAAPLQLGAGRAANDRYLPPAGPTAANPPHAAAAVDRWNRQTDRRTDTVPLRRSCRILREQYQKELVICRTTSLTPSSTKICKITKCQQRVTILQKNLRNCAHVAWLGSRAVSVLDSGAEGPGFKLQPRRCRLTVLGKLFTPIVHLFTKQRNWYIVALLKVARVTAGLAESNGSLPPGL